jgi:hypothetical protein
VITKGAESLGEPVGFTDFTAPVRPGGVIHHREDGTMSVGQSPSILTPTLLALRAPT